MSRCHKLAKYCYVCGKFHIPNSRHAFTEESLDLYELYFAHKVIQNEDWVPTTICTTCIKNLNKWKNTGSAMPFGIPMMWTRLSEHDPAECYACVNDIHGTNRKKSGALIYKSTLFAELPKPHSEIVPVPKRPSPTEEYLPPTFETMETGETGVSLYQPSTVTAPCDHIEISQNRFDIIVRRLKLSQRQAIILGKELKIANILAPDCRVYGAINRHSRFTNFFNSIENNTLAHCTDIRGLVLTLHNEYNPDDWRLFIDASKTSLKAVLLHKTNSKNSVPIAISSNTKETYTSLKKIMHLINYNAHNWKICADLKVVSILRGMQTGYTKNMCFICLWDTRFTGDQYLERNWPARDASSLRGRNNIVQIPLVSIEKVLLPPLHIKLGIVKNFIKALDREGQAFIELRRIFPKLSGMKINEGMNSSKYTYTIFIVSVENFILYYGYFIGVFNGPDIRRLMKDERFENALGELQLIAWDCVKAVIENVLGIHRSENWRILISDMLDAFHRINVRMSLKLHFLHCHAEKFGEQAPTESDEHGERFHQITAKLEGWYSGKKLDALLGEICWNLQEENDETEESAN